jgi:hypothetical protein
MRSLLVVFLFISVVFNGHEIGDPPQPVCFLDGNDTICYDVMADPLELLPTTGIRMIDQIVNGNIVAWNDTLDSEWPEFANITNLTIG